VEIERPRTLAPDLYWMTCTAGEDEEVVELEVEEPLEALVRRLRARPHQGPGQPRRGYREARGPIAAASPR